MRARGVQQYYLTKPSTDGRKRLERIQQGFINNTDPLSRLLTYYLITIVNISETTSNELHCYKITKRKITKESHT